MTDRNSTVTVTVTDAERILLIRLLVDRMLVNGRSLLTGNLDPAECGHVQAQTTTVEGLLQKLAGA